MPRRYFTPALFEFLNDLADHNDRTWFKANQDRYETVVRQPALDFIEDVAEPLYAISRHLTADARRVGGSLYGIRRDTRFAQGEPPFKTHVGIHFRHVAARGDVHAPALYLHLQPRRSYASVSLWKPAPQHRNAVWRAIVDDPLGWTSATRRREFAEVYGALVGGSLKRVPRGFDPEHPLIDDLKRTDFVSSTRLRQSEVVSAHFLETYLATVQTGVPFMRFLCRALGLDF